MSDASVAASLRSSGGLVVIEAPGGCGKTFQACAYASELASTDGKDRVLVLAHTHAACDVFASRIAGSRRVEVRTIDSLIVQITSAYHRSLDLPNDTAEWARQLGSRGYKELAERAARLVSSSPMVAQALARRYPIVICDEHQDASADQHTIVMAMHNAGSALRVFADPMQHIGKVSPSVRIADARRWKDLIAQAEKYDELDYPHRWEKLGHKKLGQWVLNAREALKAGGKIDLRSGRPPELSIVYADNLALPAAARTTYFVGKEERKQIGDLTRPGFSLLILSAHNDTVRALRPFFGRRIPVWEGHTRDALVTLTNAIGACKGDCVGVARALVAFLESITIGFTATDYSKAFMAEVVDRCTARGRLKPARLQELARLILAEPDHRGVAKALARLAELARTDRAFGKIKLDHPREYREAIALDNFDNCSDGLAEIARRRTYSRPMPAQQALSTVHKAKGLERPHVVVIPCDRDHFADTPGGRCLLYVAISRATESLTLVVPPSAPSPLLLI